MTDNKAFISALCIFAKSKELDKYEQSTATQHVHLPQCSSFTDTLIVKYARFADSNPVVDTVENGPPVLILLTS